ncbi:MAG: signal peptidase I [Planctomycetes bacterium]|nr:signal peptidase I [Planctomycetota bacterium]
MSLPPLTPPSDPSDPPGTTSSDEPSAVAAAQRAGAEADPPVEDPVEDDAEPLAPRVEDLAWDALASGPATAFEIVAAIEESEPGAVSGREGYVLPLLLEMRSRGLVGAAWIDRADGRRRVYSRAGAPDAAEPPAPCDMFDADAATPPDLPAESVGATISTGRPPAGRPAHVATAAMRAFADSATDRLEFAPRIAEDARAELLHHMLMGAAAREVEGLPRARAEADAIRALGDPWKISTDLARAARGRRTVIFPRTARDSALSLAIYDSGILVAIVAVVLFIRAQVIAAYHIPTKSMEPTLHGDRKDGDRILVLRVAPPPHRFDIEVFEGWGPERKQYVKRCCGLPGEDLRLFEGDLWIDGHLIRKEGSALDAMLFPIYDRDVERRAASRDKRRLTERVNELWVRDGGTSWSQWPQGDFEVVVADGAEPAVLRWHDRLRDDLYDMDTGELSDGLVDVADGRIAVDVTPNDDAARIVVRWARGSDVYDAVLCGEQPGVAIFIDGAEVERAPGVKLAKGRAAGVRFSQVDRVLRLEIDGEVVLRHELEEPAVPRRNGPSADVSVRVLAGSVRVAVARLERDVHWTTEYEERDRGRLGPDEFYMLGDNSSNSQDSRARGPVHRSRLVGSPLLVVWPLRRFHVPK